MASQLQLRRGTTVQHAPFIGAPAEVTVDTDKKTLVVHDGSTAGGFPVLSASGGTMTGPVSMGGSKITNLATPTASADAAPKGYVDGLIAAATLADADYGDITVSGGATVWTIDNNAVTAAKIASGAVTEAKIANDAVTTAKIASGAVTDAKIASGAVTDAKIASGAVTEAKIANDAVTTAKILDANVTTAKIADANVTNAKIASGVDASKLTTGTLPADRIGSNAITTARINNASVTAEKLSGAQTGSQPIYGARAWALVNHGANTITASGNVSSLTDNGTGDVTLNFATAMASANYSVVITPRHSDGQGNCAANFRTFNSGYVQVIQTSASFTTTGDNIFSVAVFQ